MLEYLFIAILGVCIGSFLNVLIYRVPHNISIFKPNSMCKRCENQLKWYDNIPLFSALRLDFKCRSCGESFEKLYFYVELITMIIFLVILTKLGITIDALIVSLVFSLLLALSVIDIHYRAVPDSINLSVLTVSLFYMMSIETVTNALIMMGFFSAIRFYVSYALNKEAMGEGDIIIAGVMGAIIGIKGSLIALFLGSLIALPISIYFRSKDELETAFIPFLALGTFIVFLFGDFIVNFIGI
jgi:leader peptidase (prepilin peptidase)/N-methyltransferase